MPTPPPSPSLPTPSPFSSYYNSPCNAKARASSRRPHLNMFRKGRHTGDNPGRFQEQTATHLHLGYITLHLYLSPGMGHPMLDTSPILTLRNVDPGHRSSHTFSETHISTQHTSSLNCTVSGATWGSVPRCQTVWERLSDNAGKAVNEANLSRPTTQDLIQKPLERR